MIQNKDGYVNPILQKMKREKPLLLPMALILLICLFFPGRLTRLKYLAWMGLWFALAAVFDRFDTAIFAWLSIGGHTIKHPLAAVAGYLVIAMLRDADRRNRIR